MRYKFLMLIFFFCSFRMIKPPKVKEIELESFYHKLNINHFSLPTFDSFTNAITGFYKLKRKGLIKKNILTIIDFNLSSNVKRMWIIDLDRKVVLMNTYVAHGKNTGDEFATSFSNENSSLKSSLGFYTTGEIYKGKHGISLKLDGLERGINDKARERGIVIHSAYYVSNEFIKNNKRLGRSQGCPAVPIEVSSQIINMIKNKSCLFIYHSTKNSDKESDSIS